VRVWEKERVRVLGEGEVRGLRRKKWFRS